MPPLRANLPLQRARERQHDTANDEQEAGHFAAGHPFAQIEMAEAQREGYLHLADDPDECDGRCCKAGEPAG